MDKIGDTLKVVVSEICIFIIVCLLIIMWLCVYLINKLHNNLDDADISNELKKWLSGKIGK